MNNLSVKILFVNFKSLSHSLLIMPKYRSLRLCNHNLHHSHCCCSTVGQCSLHVNQALLYELQGCCCCCCTSEMKNRLNVTPLHELSLQHHSYPD